MMNLASDRFFSGSYNFKRCANGPVESVPRYSYETHNSLYDVIDIDRVRYYRINGGPFVTTTSSIHAAIERHFNLTRS